MVKATRYYDCTRGFALAVLGALVIVGGETLRAQPVTLRIRPHVGDTLRMRLDQQFAMVGDDPPGGPAAKPMTAAMRICTRAIVLRSTTAGTELQSITDSVSVTPASAATLPLFAQTKRALQGRTVRLRVGTDGAITLSGPERPAEATPPAVVLTQVPAVLPLRAIRAGEAWVRDLRVPMSATQQTTGLVRITFHLDSLGPDGAIAYISMHGTFSHDHGRDTSGGRDQTLGTLTGTMQVDRRIAWVTDSRTTVTLISTLTPVGDPSPACPYEDHAMAAGCPGGMTAA